MTCNDIADLQPDIAANNVYSYYIANLHPLSTRFPLLSQQLRIRCQIY